MWLVHHRLTHSERAIHMRDSLCKRVLGVDPSRPGLAQAAAMPFLLFLVGSLASMQTLPSAAG